MQRKPKVLIFDIETSLMLAYTFNLGEQVIRHTQLIPSHDLWDIICITYCWADAGPVRAIVWNPDKGVGGIISEFDEVIKSADIVIGKNNTKFDNKMINTMRMMNGLTPMPEWIKSTDDLEKQMSKYFKLPSQSLDYISHKLGLGGKVKMEFNDWVKISRLMEYQSLEKLIPKTKDSILVLTKITQYRYHKTPKEVITEGKTALKKMVCYGKKDTSDTRYLWNKLNQHFEPKFNMSLIVGDGVGCRRCGKMNLVKHGTRVLANVLYQEYLCKECQFRGNRLAIKRLKKFQ